MGKQVTPGEKLAMRLWLAESLAPAPDGWFCTHKDCIASPASAEHFIKDEAAGQRMSGWGACPSHAYDLEWVAQQRGR